MKKIYSLISGLALLVLLISGNYVFSQNVGIGGGSFTPDGSAMLEIQATGQGMLIPRMSWATKPTSPAASLLIYSTDGDGTNGKGYYYWDGGAWVKLFSGASGDYIKNQYVSAQTPGTFWISGNGKLDGNLTVKGNGYFTDPGSFVTIGTSTQNGSYQMTMTPNATNQNGISIIPSGASGKGIYVSAAAVGFDGILAENSTSSTSSTVYNVGGVLTSTKIVSGYLGYRTSSGNSYGLYGLTGTVSSYSSTSPDVATWAAFLRGRTVISAESSPTSQPGTDLEIRNTTTSASSPYPASTLSMRASNQVVTSGHYMAKINFGDDFQLGPQAQIAAIRDGVGASGDLPSGITFSTIQSGTASLVERMRIINSGAVGINCTPDATYAKLDVQATSNLAYIRSKTITSGNAGLIIDRAASSGNSNIRFFTNGTENWQTGTIGGNAYNIRYVPTTFDAFSISYTSRKVGVGSVSDNMNQLYVSQASAVAGTSYGTGTKNAVYGYGQDAQWNFGITGFCQGSSIQSGGVHGAINGNSVWGVLAYNSSASSNYGGYFCATLGHLDGTGFMPNSDIQGIGSASIGDLMGSWSRGELFGQTNMGELYASYNLGNQYTSGVSADIVANNGERTAAYSVTSNDVKVYSDGKAKLANGTCKVTFDKSFIQLLSQQENPTITVSALGECEGLYIVSFDKDGFTVKEFHNGQANVEFTWIAIGKRVDADKVNKLPEAVKDKDFDKNIKGVMFNENSKEKSGLPIWWDGSKLRFDKAPVRSIEVKKDK